MVFIRKTSRLILFLSLWVVAGFQVIQGDYKIKETSFFVSMNSDQKIYGHIEQLTELLDRILIQKNQILNDEDKARIQKVYQLIDQSLLKELKECDFLKNIDVAELEK